MAFLSFENLKVSGISACVPKEIDDNRTTSLIPDDERENLINSIGIVQKRIAPEGVCASDLCYFAAEKLIKELKWDKSEIQALIFVSQTPDYILPATSCILQDRLGLSSECLAIDISLGCSGWVYGMSTLASYMGKNNIAKALLLSGDLATRTNSPRNRSDFPLFGDAGTCTAIEYDEGASGIKFHLATDGSGKDAIIIPYGGYRNPITVDSLEYKDYGNGEVRTGLHASMDGMSVFSFAITKGPKSVKMLCEHYGIDMTSVDCFTFHQANKLITEKICKKLKLDADKCPNSMEMFGNTSCATIPLTLVTQRKESLESSKMSHIACAFGVGLSWGSVYFDTENIVVPELIEL
ncbi:MAG: ketoacyl-ACP synthase III [Bacteroidales bacterium]|nr:ketoacyl-ACP synthase III [Bacteroidales bacterium]